MLIESWVHRWGDAYTYFFDLGGEFDNLDMERYCAEASAEMLTAPRGAHYMHGLTERNGYLLKVLLTRLLLEHPSLPFETVVQEAAAQKRAYDNVDGRPPYVRLIGRNPRTRGVMEANLGGLSNVSEDVRCRIRELARKHLVLMDTDIRIRQALLSRARIPVMALQLGQKVHVLLSNDPVRDPGYSGVGRGVGQHGSGVLVRF